MEDLGISWGRRNGALWLRARSKSSVDRYENGVRKVILKLDASVWSEPDLKNKIIAAKVV